MIGGKLFVHIEAHVGQLQTDVGIEMVGRNRVEDLMVELGTVARLIGIGDIFAEVVDGHAHPRTIYGLRGSNRIGDFGACYESA